MGPEAGKQAGKGRARGKEARQSGAEELCKTSVGGVQETWLQDAPNAVLNFCAETWWPDFGVAFPQELYAQ